MKIWFGLILLGLGLASSEAAAQSPPNAIGPHAANQLTQLKFLMDYTLFHIGAYITLSTLLVTLLGLEGFKQRAMGMKYFLLLTLACFVLAGICGGIVASNIPYFTSVDELRNANIGPFLGVPAYPLIVWTSLEHSFFWAGVFSALIGVGKIIVFGSNTGRSAAATAERARQIGRVCLEAADHVEPNEAPTFTKMGQQLLQLGSDADARSEADAKGFNGVRAITSAIVLGMTVIILLAAVTLVFILQNREAVTMSFLGFSIRAPLAILIAAVYVIGAVTGGVFALLRRSKRSIVTPSAQSTGGMRPDASENSQINP